MRAGEDGKAGMSRGAGEPPVRPARRRSGVEALQAFDPVPRRDSRTYFVATGPVREPPIVRLAFRIR